MKFIKSKKGIAALLATLAVVAFASVGAYAYFTNGGSTTQPNAVSDGTTTPFTVTVTPDSTAALLPAALGDSNAQYATVPVSVVNNDEGVEHLHQLVVSVVPFTIPGSGGGEDCTEGDFAVQASANDAAGNATSSLTLTPDATLQPSTDAGNEYDTTVYVSLVEDGGNQNACENAHLALKAVAS